MSESLRDQLLQAGFRAPEESVAPKARNTGSRPGKPAGRSTPAHSGKQAAAQSGKNTGAQSADGGGADPAKSSGGGAGADPAKRSGGGAGAHPAKRSGGGAGAHPAKRSGGHSEQQRGKRAGSGRSAAGAPSPPTEDAQAVRRKLIKAQIKTLIEDVGLRDYQGESVYRFMLNQRIRELHVKDDVRLQLVAGTLFITRLNGITWLVPESTATVIRELNPDWVVVRPIAESSEDISGYEDFPVPDDLQW